MRYFFIFLFVVLSSVDGFAQRVRNIQEYDIPVADEAVVPGLTGARTSAISDTFILPQMLAADTVLYGVAGGGYVTGTDKWEDKSFAEYYNFSGNDSSIQVLGVLARFGGTVNPASTQTVNFNVWDQSYPVPITGTQIYNGFPYTILDSQTVAVTNLGIGPVASSLKEFWFSTPTSFLSAPFYVGYSMTYFFDTTTGLTLHGDNFGLASSKNRVRTAATADSVFLQYNNNLPGIDPTLDTFLIVQNATQGADNTWYDNYTQNDGLYNNLAIYPIVVIGYSTAGVSSVGRNGLTFFGNYPNPCNNNTNIKFSLAQQTGITLQVMDAGGRVVYSRKADALAAGEHILPLSTEQFPAGDYVYLVQTSMGAGMAGKLTVLHP